MRLTSLTESADLRLQISNRGGFPPTLTYKVVEIRFPFVLLERLIPGVTSSWEIGQFDFTIGIGMRVIPDFNLMTRGFEPVGHQRQKDYETFNKIAQRVADQFASVCSGGPYANVLDDDWKRVRWIGGIPDEFVNSQLLDQALERGDV